MAWRRDLIFARLAGRDVEIPREPPPPELPTRPPATAIAIDPLLDTIPRAIPVHDLK